MKRAAFLCTEWGHPSTQSDSVLQFLTALSQLGYSITVLCKKSHPTPLLKIPLIILQSPQVPEFFGLKDKLFREQLKKWLKNDKYDLVVTNASFAEANLFVITSPEEIKNISPQTLTNKTIIVPSQHHKKQIVEILKDHNVNCEICYPTYSRSEYSTKERQSRREIARRTLNIVEPRTLVGYVRSRSKNPEAELRTNELIEWLTKTDSEQHKYQLIDIEDQQLALFALDAYIDPSASTEFDSHALHAMACGIPLIVQNLSPASEIILSKQLVKAHFNLEDWGATLLEILNNTDWAKAVTRQNAESATHLDEPSYRKRVLQIVDQISSS